MTGNRSLFHEIKLSSKGSVTFGDNRSCKIIGTGSIESDSGIKLNKVHLVDGLKHNLLSISQICKEGYSIAFDSDVCCIKKKDNDNIAISGYKKGNIYHIDLNSNDHLEHLCLISIKNDLQLAWHRKLGHVSQNTLARLGNFNIVRGLPKLNYSKDFFCDACAKGKHVRSSFKSKKDITTNRNLELVHLDLFGPTNIQSLGELSTGDINREKDLKQSAGNSNLEAISHSTGHETDDLDKQAPPHIIQRHPPSQVIGNFNERNLLK
ncbi:hypothetical protein LINGRAHAP2_LOCUS25162 [Linum grandiflorum]